MKLLHTSDWHLGMARPGGMTYESDQNYVIGEVCRIAEEEDADGILLAGDVFDKSVASRDAIRMYDRIMTRICGEMKIPVYLIAGNHDGAARIAQCSDLLRASGLFIAGALTKEPRVIDGGDADIFLLPWISTDKVKSVYPEEAEKIRSLEDAYRVVLDRYRERFTPGRRNILVAHAYVRGAETSVSDRAAEIGGATMVGSRVFDGFDYVALGHLHGPQKVTENIRYSGSPMAYAFGREENQEKSVVIVDTEDMSAKLIPIPQLHRRATLTGTFEELMQADVDDETREGYLRLEVTDSYVGAETMAAFRERYPNLLELDGKDYEREDSRITMTIEELDAAETDPQAVFLRYCRDILEEEPGEHLKGLFDEALRKYAEEVTEE